jgi:hypothetical protein
MWVIPHSAKPAGRHFTVSERKYAHLKEKADEPWSSPAVRATSGSRAAVAISPAHHPTGLTPSVDRTTTIRGRYEPLMDNNNPRLEKARAPFDIT